MPIQPVKKTSGRCSERQASLLRRQNVSILVYLKPQTYTSYKTEEHGNDSAVTAVLFVDRLRLMATPRRPPLWSQSWTHGTLQEAAKDVRKSVVKELLQAIKDNDYDAQTLEEVNFVLDYDYLCCQLQDSPTLRPHFESAIGTHMVGDFADHLSSCLVKFVNAASYSERALQCRALVSVFALLQLHGVRSQQTVSQNLWQDQIKCRFQELVWLPDEKSQISPEILYKSQCSYLLCLTWAYAQKVPSAEPLSMVGMGIAKDIIQLGIVVVTTALGSGFANLGASLQDLDANFTRLLRSPDDRYPDLFKLQGLTRIAVALQLFSQSADQSVHTNLLHGSMKLKTLKASGTVAVEALRQIVAVLSSANNAHFETKSRQSSKVRDQWLAMMKRGPAKLDEYNYFYGLLDSAAQLTHFLEPVRYPDGLEVRMRSIIRRSREVNFRWKALEVLLSNPRHRSQQIQKIMAESDQPNLEDNLPNRRQLNSEISVICEYLRGDDSSDCGSQRALSTIEVMNPTCWIEEPVCAKSYSTRAQKFQFPLPRGQFYKRVHFSAAGLSTQCSYAYFLNHETILVYSLGDTDATSGREPIFQKRASAGVMYHAAALSERFIVVLLDEGPSHAIQVFRYDGKLIGIDAYGVEASGHQWNATDLIAVSETNDRTWIAIGGWVKEEGILAGSIKMHCVDEIGESATVRRCHVSFQRPKPNPLGSGPLRTLDFSPDGKRLVCTTNNHRILIWQLSNNKRPSGAPFVIPRNLEPDTEGGRISSVSIFHSPLSRPYLLCTTMPSRERVVNKGEWSFISPIGSSQTCMNEKLVRNLTRLKNTGHVLAGAVGPDSDIFALLISDGRDKGRIMIMPMVAEPSGGFSTLDPTLSDAGTLRIRESRKRIVSPTAMRFRRTNMGFTLIAVDREGNVIKTRFIG